MTRRILLAPKIHFINLPLFFLLSFIYKIKTLEMQVPCSYLVRKRIKLLQLEEYFNWEECMVMRADAVKIWENILPKFPEESWKIHIKSFELNMSKKAKQDIQREFEKLFLLKNIVDYNKNNQNVYIINSLHFNFLKSIGKNKEFFSYPTLHFLSFINTILDRFFLYLLNLSIELKLIVQLIYGLLYRKDLKENISTIKYIWDGISPRELSVDKDKITFAWIIDNAIIHKDEVLFLLPKADFQMKDFSEDEATGKGLLIANYFNMVCFVSNRILLASLYEVLKLTIKNIISLEFTIKGIMNIKYTLQILKWVSVVEYLKPRVYVNSFSSVGIEDPAIIYFQKAGIKTIMWSYGSNTELFTTQNRNCDFRGIINCNILSSNMIVWNNRFKEFIENHPQNDLKIIVIGPLMSGDESVFTTSPDILRKRIGLNHIQDNNSLKYIAVFDVPPASKAFRGSETVCPDSNTEEYNCAFIRDVFRLLSDFEDLFLLYKPKRSLTSGKFSYNDEFREILKEMRKNPRVIILDYNINPWLPIASADITISMPFESPFIASIHYGKPSIFHDPTNIAHHHRYQDVSDFITHSYEELKSKVNYRLFDSDAPHLDITNEYKLRDFVGVYPGTNSSERFREYLVSL